MKSHADGKKHQTVAGKLHATESITQFLKAKSDKIAENLKLGIQGNLLPDNCIKLP